MVARIGSLVSDMFLLFFLLFGSLLHSDGGPTFVIARVWGAAAEQALAQKIVVDACLSLNRSLEGGLFGNEVRISWHHAGVVRLSDSLSFRFPLSLYSCGRMYLE